MTEKSFLEFVQQLVNGLSQGSIYALIALGYTMVFGVLRFINFAHGDVYMLGAFAGWLFFAAPDVGPDGLPKPGVFAALTRSLAAIPPGMGKVLLVLMLAMIICAIIGILIEWLCYRPLRDRPKLTVLITAIGVSLFLENGGQFVFGAKPLSFPTIIKDVPLVLPKWLGGLSKLNITNSQVLIFGITLLLLVALTYIVRKTKMGMAMRALSFNPVAAQLMGVNINVIIAFTFGLGSALAGAAGILTSIPQPSIDPLMGVNAGLKAFVAAVLGGIGNLPGAALGGILIGLLEALIAGYVSSTYRDPMVFGVLILVLLVKPTGLLGASEREKV